MHFYSRYIPPILHDFILPKQAFKKSFSGFFFANLHDIVRFFSKTKRGGGGDESPSSGYAVVQANLCLYFKQTASVVRGVH
jgi:hypothetical protein